jgi:hypothetical protein
MTENLNFVIRWQIAQIHGFTVLTDLKPQFRPLNNPDLPPTLTFDFPQTQRVGETMSLNLVLKNQATRVIEVMLQVRRDQDFMWLGKTSHILHI